MEFVASSVNMHLSLKAYSHSDWFSFLYWKLPIFDVLYQLQLKFFIISYVFNLERRKYVAVWFFISRKEFNVYQHDILIFMNMIIWPLMTYTVTSFGKAFAHVRNLLAENNMQYNLFTIFPLLGPFAEFGFVFIDFITYFQFSVSFLLNTII